MFKSSFYASTLRLLSELQVKKNGKTGEIKRQDSADQLNGILPFVSFFILRQLNSTSVRRYP